MDPRQVLQLHLTRRYFLQGCSLGLGSTALASLLNPRLFAEAPGA